jgi:hypothetical protein
MARASKRPTCFGCDLLDRLEESGGQTGRRRLFARAMAYGCKVLGRGKGIATCDACHHEIEVAIEELERELRAARRRIAAARAARE